VERGRGEPLEKSSVILSLSKDQPPGTSCVPDNTCSCRKLILRQAQDDRAFGWLAFDFRVVRSAGGCLILRQAQDDRVFGWLAFDFRVVRSAGGRLILRQAQDDGAFGWLAFDFRVVRSAGGRLILRQAQDDVLSAAVAPPEKAQDDGRKGKADSRTACGGYLGG
jgi:hypothetical protein